MKLIITGASGFVATAVLDQALRSPSITSVVAVARTSISPPPGLSSDQASKLKSVVVKDYGTYSSEIKQAFGGANACIWTVAITPSKARALPSESVKQVCQEWTIAGFKAILEANPNPPQPLRFLYMSGSAAFDPANLRAKDKKVWMPKNMVAYSRMRGETATLLHQLAAQNENRVQVCVAKPGFITGGEGGVLRGLFGSALWLTGLVETIDLQVIAKAMLHYATVGFQGMDGILLNDEMVEAAKRES